MQNRTALRAELYIHACAEVTGHAVVILDESMGKCRGLAPHSAHCLLLEQAERDTVPPSYPPSS